MEIIYMKTAIVFWSGTGNTEAMAQAVANGVKAAGAEVDLLTCDKFNETMIDDYDLNGSGTARGG